MDRYQIRLGKTDSVNSVNEENFLDVQLTSTSKKLHFNDIKATIDQYEQFKKERNESTKYRIILTINPYCSNVLFNPLTEVAKANDNGTIERHYNNDTTISNGIDGFGTPKRIQMICNTEYSKTEPDSRDDDKYGYTYMPGFDIFDNHILRNTSFKIVEPTETNQNVYNTIADYYRNSDKSIVKFSKRYNLKTKPKKVSQHLYASDDVLSFEDSVNANLTDENGWFGFINASNLKTKGPGDDGELSKISCAINNRKNCDFIDMYPDRTTFTFSPYYNKLYDRIENNWEVYVTYAFDKDECDPLVGNSKVKNALAVLSITKSAGISGEDIVVFRCYTKHNLSRGNFIKVFDGTSDTAEEDAHVFMVSNLGNSSNGDPDYYFYLDANDFPESLFECSDIRIRKTYNGMDSWYYRRKLKRIGDISNERYKLAFASTIYDDDTTQITFTEDINIRGIKDNLGRPLTELFITIVKTNYGHEEWYSGGDTINSVNAEKIQKSHCFGDITSGFILSNEKTDKTEVLDYGNGNVQSVETKLEYMQDATRINNNNKFKSYRPQTNVDPSSDNIIFPGDIVEFSPEDCMEHVLADCVHRFNSYQREHQLEPRFTYHEILYDDYDMYKNETDFLKTDDTTPNLIRDEGYYYKSNYSIPIKALGDIVTDGNKEIRVKEANPAYNGSVVLRVKSSLPSRLNTNDIVYVCDDKNNRFFEFICTEVKSPTLFSIEPKNAGKWAWFKDETESIYGDGLTWLSLSQLLNNGSVKLRGRNYDIPDYAYKSGVNTYMWRNVLTSDESFNASIPEYTFANDAFYLTPIIRFYLRRQDPDSSVGLQAKEMFPNDIFGNIKKQSNYYYEDEPQDLC